MPRGDAQKAKTACPKGHPYDEENTMWVLDGHGKPCRKCKTCRMAYDRAKANRRYERLKRLRVL